MGLHRILVWQRHGEKRLRVGRPHLVAASFLFGWSVFLMLVLHLLEILIWAFALNHLGLIEHGYDAIYYTANCYTTLGMGKVDVLKDWRILSPIIGISGLFTFAWTTSALVNVISTNARLAEQLENERELEIEMRRALRKQERDLVAKARADERAEKLKSKTTAPGAGTSVLERYRIWREERRSVATLRREALSQLMDLRGKERADEEKLGPGKFPGSDDGE